MADPPDVTSSSIPALAGAIEPTAVLEPGATFGRYRVVALAGRGGMGEVYRARDPRLERDVALKVVRGDAFGASRSAHERMLREAQAMARLAHPNVVTVFDAGEVGDRVYVAMEFVEGRTLAGWLRERPRTLREVIDVLLLAGRGLAEVHRAGVVHRDFKPENVIVGSDGRVRVSDFGLASRATGPFVDPAGETSPALDDTQVGSTSGTPAYMAPEQHLGQPVDARADQFAFCLSLWEGLAGKRAFSGTTLAEVRENVLAGRVDEPAPGRVPAWVRVILDRGLEGAPERRFPSMDALLAALARDPAQRRRRWLAGVAGVTAAVGIFVLARRGAVDADPCRPDPALLAGSWEPARRAAIERAFLASPRPYAPETFRRVAGALDDYAAAWTRMRREACEATAVRHEQSEALLDLRMQCLDRRLGEVAAVTTLLAAGPDSERLDRLVQAVHQLGDLGACADRQQLASVVPLPADPARRAAVAGVRTRLAAAHALELTGKFKPALALAGVVAEEARAVAFAPVLGEALGRLAEVMQQLRLPARATFYQQLEAAGAAHDDAMMAQAWISLINIIGTGEGKPAEALALRPAAEAALARIGDDRLLRGKLVGTVGRVLIEAADYPAAAAALEEAIAITEKDPRHDELKLAAFLNSLGIARRQQGDLEGARAGYERALAILEQTLGPEHPWVAGMVHNLGLVLFDEERYDEAKARLGHALAIWERVLGPDSADVAGARHNLGEIALMQGRLDEAGRELGRALEIKQKVFGPDHPILALTLLYLGQLALARGEPAAARAYLTRGLAIRERATPGHPESAALLSRLAGVAIAEGKPQEALATCDRIADKGPDAALCRATALAAAGKLEEACKEDARAAELERAGTPEQAQALAALGECELRRPGRRAQAAAALERAVAILEQRGTAAALDRAAARFALARALGDPGRALNLAGLARAAYARVESEDARRRVAEIDRWLAARRPADH